MKWDKSHLGLYAVTDRTWTGQQSLYWQVEEALKGGVTCVQLREKELEAQAFLKEALEIKALCHAYKALFFVNDNVEVALGCSADGIHVGQQDMQALAVRERIGEDMILGVSVRTVEQAVYAQRCGADYLGAGAVFSTSTKLDARPLGHEILKAICGAVSIPVVAIGGIQKENILELRGTGVEGVALVAAIFAGRNIREDCRTLRALADKLRRE